VWPRPRKFALRGATFLWICRTKSSPSIGQQSPRKGAVTGSLEVREKRLDDPCLDVLADPADRLCHIGRFSAWPGLAERYAEHEVGILVVFDCLSEGNLGKWVAVFERTKIDEVDKVQQFPVVGNAGALGDDEMERPVLIEVVQSVEILERGSILSTVRLHRFDETPRLWMHGSNSVIEIPLRRLASPKDRELGLFLNSFGQRVPLVRDGKVEGQVVEGAAEVKKTLPDKRPPADQGRLPTGVEDPVSLLVFDVVLAGDAVCVGVNEAKEAALKVLSMHVCPTELLADPSAYSASHKGEG